MDNNDNKLKTSIPTAKDLIAKVNLLSNARSFATNPLGLGSMDKGGARLNNENFVHAILELGKVKNPTELLATMHKVVSHEVDCQFVAMGVLNEKSACLNIKLIDKLGNNYSSKVFLKETENPVVKCFESNESVFVDDAEFLKFAYFHSVPALILPMNTR